MAETLPPDTRFHVRPAILRPGFTVVDYDDPEGPRIVHRAERWAAAKQWATAAEARHRRGRANPSGPSANLSETETDR